MAEGALRHLLQQQNTENFEVISSGTAAASGFPATLYAIEAAKTWEIDISQHLSQPLSSDLIKKADLIFAMTPGHYEEILRIEKDVEDKTYLLKSFPDNNPKGDGVADPIGMSLEDYNKTFLEIGEYLGRHIDETIKRIKEKQNA
jgi:protein-tyrosine phosphatase